jgi:hypothetical protein
MMKVDVGHFAGHDMTVALLGNRRRAALDLAERRIEDRCVIGPAGEALPDRYVFSIFAGLTKAKARSL